MRECCRIECSSWGLDWDHDDDWGQRAEFLWPALMMMAMTKEGIPSNIKKRREWIKWIPPLDHHDSASRSEERESCPSLWTPATFHLLNPWIPERQTKIKKGGMNLLSHHDLKVKSQHEDEDEEMKASEMMKMGRRRHPMTWRLNYFHPR